MMQSETSPHFTNIVQIQKLSEYYAIIFGCKCQPL